MVAVHYFAVQTSSKASRDLRPPVAPNEHCNETYDTTTCVDLNLRHTWPPI